MTEPYVTVCACTYRRPEGLRALLGGFAAQRFAAVPRPRFDVVIVDNEGSAEAVVKQTADPAHRPLLLKPRHELARQRPRADSTENRRA